MFIKHDYDYEELKQFVSPNNYDIYNLIKDNNKQDNFVMMMYDYWNDITLTGQEFDWFLTQHKEQIKQKLKLK